MLAHYLLQGADFVDYVNCAAGRAVPEEIAATSVVHTHPGAKQRKTQTARNNTHSSVGKTA